MFSTGSKLYLGLTAAAVAGTVLYGITQNFGALGGVGLVFLSIALAGLATAVISAREGDVSAMDAAAATTAPATVPPVGGSLWPMVGALGALLLVIGTVTDVRYFVAGIAVSLIAIVEWMVQGWSERASADRAYNAKVRAYVLHPLELPIAGALGLATVIYGFSRVMLSVPEKAGPAIFVVAAALITTFGVILFSKPALRNRAIGAICAVGAVLVVAGGLAGAATGERSQLGEESANKEFAAANRDCESADVTEADKDSGGAVAGKSNPWATLVFDGTKLTAKEIAGAYTDTITIDRGNTVSVLFKNEGSSPVRLTVYGGTDVADVSGVSVKTPRLSCTRAIGKGKSTWLTFKLPKATTAADPFYAYIPGHDTARVSVVVP